MSKRALLVAGGGTIGLYVAKELLEMGHEVDIICLNEVKSDNPRLRIINERASVDYLTEFLKDNRYDSIVNFIHYTKAEAYKPYHELLTAHCDQLIFLSSYRVYADLEHPITESAPLLGDTLDDRVFLETEGYAMGKTRCERYLHSAEAAQNYTIIRPVISFAVTRFDLICHSAQVIIEAAKKGETLPLPIGSKDIHAGLDWAGNSGKIIANLMFKPETIGETYTISSAPNLKWGEVAEYYTELVGAKFEWIDNEEYLKLYPDSKYGLLYDRLYDREIDAAKVLAATGLTKADFKSIREGIEIELAKL